MPHIGLRNQEIKPVTRNIIVFASNFPINTKIILLNRSCGDIDDIKIARYCVTLFI